MNYKEKGDGVNLATATMPARVENGVGSNGGMKRQPIHHEGENAARGVCGKKGCWYGYGCFRVPQPTQVAISGCPAMRVWRNLRERTKSALMCLVSMSWMQPAVPPPSSAAVPKPSKQPSASSDSHRSQAVEDCISYINSSSASSTSSSSIALSRSPPPKTSVPDETPPQLIPESSATAAVTIPSPPPPPLPPPHFSPISATTQDKLISSTPST
ncbi:hypothetical protein MLD38_040102 [Melastoma candidum]|uniref:Uncharacterized protein n=1 Tax=Melastoma candidum TaxID=119954 RepID=A0ACB9L5M9_9MYRT|nr:hypothetical protein MLD38_040102 [Melastoma candidum]